MYVLNFDEYENGHGMLCPFSKNLGKREQYFDDICTHM